MKEILIDTILGLYGLTAICILLLIWVSYHYFLKKPFKEKKEIPSLSKEKKYIWVDKNIPTKAEYKKMAFVFLSIILISLILAIIKYHTEDFDTNMLKWEQVESSAISSIGYNDRFEKLAISFNDSKDEGWYIYSDVPKDIYKDFINSNSIGQYYNSNIKGKYDCYFDQFEYIEKR